MFTAADVSGGDGIVSTVAVSSDGTTALVGAEKDDRTKGSAYVFEASSGSWSQQAKLAPDVRAKSSRFGRSVTASGDGTTALVGDPNYLNSPPGAAYVFAR